MMGETHNCKKAKPTAVDLAVAALDGNPNPLDMDMNGIDPDPTSLDLDDADENGICSEPRRSCPMVDACIICGQRQCDDCF